MPAALKDIEQTMNQIVAACIPDCEHVQDYGPYIYISMMGVRPDMQRKGLGGLLLKTVSHAHAM